MRLLMMTVFCILLASCSNRSKADIKTEDLLHSDTLKMQVSEKAIRYKQVPDFTIYKDVNEKKKAFFDFLIPMVNEENEIIRNDRKLIQHLFARQEKNIGLSDSDLVWLNAQAINMRMKTFDVASEEDRKTLLSRVDVVPVSLFLAQAANESSWGTSRFARKANNLFGQWCYKPGCGLVPTQRAAGEKQEVRKFATVNAAVKSYVRNINSNNAYKDLRMLRENMRANHQEPDGITLAGGLLNYSARREEYVKEIRQMIRYNNLEDYK